MLGVSPSGPKRVSDHAQTLGASPPFVFASPSTDHARLRPAEVKPFIIASEEVIVAGGKVSGPEGTGAAAGQPAAMEVDA